MDDCVLFIESADLHRLSGIDRWMLDFGFTLTREEPVYELEKVVFCQAQPVYTASGWRMVRNPFTAMSKDCVSLVGWSNEVDVRYWATAIGKCGHSLTRGVPVWEAWYGQLLRMGEGVENQGVGDRVWDCGMGYMARGVTGCDITPEARVSFWRAFGVLPDTQEALEEHYRSSLQIDFDVRPMENSPVFHLDRANNPLSYHACQH